MNFKGVMFSDVPNLAAVIGYTNASWTLKCDLTCAYIARLIKYMDRHGYAASIPRLDDPSVTPEPLIDFSSGYIHRAIDQFPRQGSKKPWGSFPRANGQPPGFSARFRRPWSSAPSHLAMTSVATPLPIKFVGVSA